jgi:hypothetical protein
MKEVLERLTPKHLFTSFSRIETSLIQTRKKISIFNGVDEKRYYHLVMYPLQKSRFVLKHAEEIGLLASKVALHVNHNYAHKHLFLNAPLCSKAQHYLEQAGWRIYR